MRSINRTERALRKINITRNYMKFAEGSCLIELGNTKVICTATLEDGVPPFLKGKGSGWVSAEYAMLPRSCKVRVPRESVKGRVAGRTHEIQRLIGRSLRSVTDLTRLGERTIWMDCDVIQADGGTRCASITGSFIALFDCFEGLKKEKLISEIPLKDYLAAVSVGIVDGRMLLDLDYKEDSNAEVDMNVVMTSRGKFIELQGTAEKEPFSETEMEKLLNLAKMGLAEIINIEKKMLGKLKL